MSSQSLSSPETTAAVSVPWERVEKFVGQFTHDIRNGLNALELQLTFLGEISTDPEAVAEVKQLRASLGELSRQLQAVKLKTGSISAHPMDYPVSDFFEDLRERFERLHKEALGRVDWDIAGGGSLHLDPELSIAALLEILGNCLHFCSQSEPVTFAARSGGDEHVQITISHALDQAPEIPVCEWGLTPLLSTRRSAYGLGLFRSRRVLEAQGAKFTAMVNEDFRLMVMIVFPAAATR